MSLFVEGKFFKEAGANGGGGGGSDPHNLGYYATQAALEEAHPTAGAGDWAIVGETDTVWVWDSDSTSWKDTDSKAEVTPDMVIIKAKVMPAASSTPADAMYQYTGATNATYTTNYIYRNIKTATYTGTVSFEAATLSGTTVTCSGADFANFLTEAGADPTPIVSGTMTYEADANGWRLVGKDSNDNTVTTFIEYVEDYEDAGFVFTGTPQDNDVIAFTCTVEEASATYTWTRIDVQPTPVIPDPLPSQTGNAGKFLTTDGTDASWSDKPLANKSTNGTSILGYSTTGSKGIAIGVTNADNWASTKASGNLSVAIGAETDGNAVTASGNSSIAIGASTQATGGGAIAIGISAKATATGAVQIGWAGTNSDAGTIKFRPYNVSTNYTLVNSDGTIPADRLTKSINKYSTMPTASASNEGWIVQFTGTTDSTYTHGYIYECVSDGGNPATYSWSAVEVQASSGGSLPSQSGNAGKFLTTDGTDASWSDKPLQNNATGNLSVAILGTATGGNSVSIGDSASVTGNWSVAIGRTALASANDAIAIGTANVKTQGSISIGGNQIKTGAHAISIGHSTGGQLAAEYTITLGYLDTLNSLDSHSFYVGLSNASSGTYKLLSSDGTIPAARHASLPATDGTYVLKLVIANGVPTLSWVAE